MKTALAIRERYCELNGMNKMGTPVELMCYYKRKEYFGLASRIVREHAGCLKERTTYRQVAWRAGRDPDRMEQPLCSEPVGSDEEERLN